MKKIILTLITSLAFAITMPLISQASPLAYPIERIAGQDRVDTALSISQTGWQSAETVILCEYSDYPDSIASTPFAANQNAPILLTEGHSLDPRVVKELERLKPKKVILLGGIGTLKPSIEKELEQLTLNVQWERIGGADRYETSILLAKKIQSDSIILANGDDFPDALSAASFAGIKQIPIVLTSKSLPDSVRSYLQEVKPEHVLVVGGEAVVPSEELLRNNISIETRLGGQDRYDTNAKVTSYVKDTYEADDLFLASGITFPDAVAGTVLAAKYKAPLFLIEKEDIPVPVYTLLREHMKVEPPSTSQAQPETPPITSKQGTTTAVGGLNLRDTPASTGNKLVTIPVGAKLEILEEKGDWIKTTFQSKTGWVYAEYVTIETITSAPPAKAPEPLNGKITASAGLNLRETPSTSGKTLATIPNDTKVEILEKKDQWYKTTYQTQTGWIFAEYVTLLSNTTDISVNGTVYILGGAGVISPTAQNIIEGKASSKYKENLRDFPPLPPEIKKPEPPSRGGTPPENPTTPPPAIPVYDPAKEILVDPFQGIPANSLAGKTIMIDPGHGGPDVGAVGPSKTYEKNNTLAIALALNDILKKAGAKVILTRDKDISPAANYSEIADLQARVELANQSKADLFISIHNDAYSNPVTQGSSVFYSSDNEKPNESLHLASNIRTAVIDTVQTTDRGIKEAGFFVVRNTKMPAILLETAFISNPYEEARLQNSTFQKNVAAALFKGIYKYYTTPLPKD